MYLNQQGRFYLGGFSDNIYDYDVERLRILRQLSIDEKDCILMKYSQSRSLLCSGSTNGQINIRDPFSLKSLNVLHPHNGSLSDFDVHGNYLVSCGFSTRYADCF
jgi:PAB-dependent poly(A)-specific ribonuclease subunit 2